MDTSPTPPRLNEETRAFVAGYLTHLVLDEQYITSIYRRFFYPHEAMGGSLRANVMDRLLQFDLERAHGDAELRADLCAALACTIDTIDAGFVDAETLERWRQVACDIAARGMDWGSRPRDDREPPAPQRGRRLGGGALRLPRFAPRTTR